MPLIILIVPPHPGQVADLSAASWVTRSHSPLRWAFPSVFTVPGVGQG